MSSYLYLNLSKKQDISEEEAIDSIVLQNPVLKKLNDKEKNDCKELLENAYVSLSYYNITEILNELNLNSGVNEVITKEKNEQILKEINKQWSNSARDLKKLFRIIYTTKFENINESYFTSSVQSLEAELIRFLDEVKELSIVKDLKGASISKYLVNKAKLESYFDGEPLFIEKFKEPIEYIQEIFSSFDNNYSDKDFVAEAIVSDIEDIIHIGRLCFVLTLAYELGVSVKRDN